MSDTIFLKGLALHAYHGVMQHEAKVGQTFYVDLQLDLELANASRTDKRSAADAIAWWKRPPARWPTPYWRPARKCAASALRCTSRTRQWRRHSRMSA
jgi:hypothetical protein